MSRGLSLFVLALILAAGISLRAVNLGADAPSTLPNGLSSSALLKDEAAKCFAPRSRALFGEWSPSPADDYRYWETLSPVWTWSLYLWFKAAGPGYLPARVFSILWSAVSIVALYLLLAGKSRAAALLAAALFAVNFYAVIYGRLALLETPLNALLLLCFALQVRGREKPWLLAPASLLWLGAWFVKQSAGVYLPALTIGALMPFFSKTGEGERKGAIIPLLAVVMVTALAAACFLSPDYRIRSIMNLRHTLDFRPDPTFLWMQVDPARTWLAVKTNLSQGLLRGYFLMMPVAGPLAIIEFLLIGLDLMRRKRVGTLHLIAAAWWLSARVALTIMGQSSPRFYLIQVPPTIILAAMAVERFLGLEPFVKDHKESGAARATWPARAVIIACIFMAAFIHLLPWWSWVRSNPRELKRGAEELSLFLRDKPAVVVGEWAGPLCFDTSYKYYYLKSVFNRLPDQIAALGITHLLVKEGWEEGLDMDPAVRRLRKFFPSAYEKREERGRITLWKGEAGETELILYSISVGLRP